MNKFHHTLVCIMGPTAVGKTALSINLAKYFNTEIINADARQFYREMNIGTAKPSGEQLSIVKHHFINSHSIDTLYSAGDFEVDALKLLEQLFTTHKIVILCGGSGLYLKAITEGLDELPGASIEIRKELNILTQSEKLKELQERLKEVDPEFYASADIQNPQRVVRALEVFYTSGKPISSFHQNENKKRTFNIIKIILNVDRNLLYENINSRVDYMMKMGLIEEVKQLLPKRDRNALKTVGYSELFDYFDGKTNLQEAVSLVKQHTRNFAKRQITWFKKEKNAHWFNPDEKEKIISLIEMSV